MKRLSALVAMLGLAACAAEPAPKAAISTTHGPRFGAGDSLGQRLGRSDRALARANGDARTAHAEVEEPDR
ncbi:MAG: hypothetical protein ACKVW3_03875 [Phycisphaerales bacterium]